MKDVILREVYERLVDWNILLLPNVAAITNLYTSLTNKQECVVLHRVHVIRQGPVYYCQVRNQLQLLKTSVTTIPSRTTVMAVLATRIRSLVTRHEHQ